LSLIIYYVLLIHILNIISKTIRPAKLFKKWVNNLFVT
jgi:hypothetical protein